MYFLEMSHAASVLVSHSSKALKSKVAFIEIESNLSLCKSGQPVTRQLVSYYGIVEGDQ